MLKDSRSLIVKNLNEMITKSRQETGSGSSVELWMTSKWQSWLRILEARPKTIF